MSYSIVYNKQFLKIDEKIIPLVLCGDSNCYESLPNGRKRRERQWYSLYFNSTNEPIAATEKEIMKRVKSHCGGGGAYTMKESIHGRRRNSYG